MNTKGWKSARTIGTVFAVGALCAACAMPARIDGMSDGEYRATFTQVIGKTLADAKKDNLCLPPALLGFGPVTRDPKAEINTDLPEAHTLQAPLGRLAQFEALVKAGLVTREDSTREVLSRTQHFATFRPTAKAAPYVDNNTLCYARATLDRVVKWKGPIALGDYRAAYVYYTTKAGPAADWARMPEMNAAFPGIAAALDVATPKVRQVAIDKSSDGWDVAEYSKLLQLD